MHKACFLCFPYIFSFSNFILHTLISSHYLGLEFAMQVQTHLISSTMKNTMKLMKIQEEYHILYPGNIWVHFNFLEFIFQGEDHVLKAQSLDIFVKQNLLWISLTVHACGQKHSRDPHFSGPILKATTPTQVRETMTSTLKGG